MCDRKIKSNYAYLKPQPLLDTTDALSLLHQMKTKPVSCTSCCVKWQLLSSFFPPWGNHRTLCFSNAAQLIKPTNQRCNLEAYVRGFSISQVSLISMVQTKSKPVRCHSPPAVLMMAGRQTQQQQLPNPTKFPTNTERIVRIGEEQIFPCNKLLNKIP